jgi:CO/xanthine dehydrogenase Mo-binding subunit
MLHGKVLWVAYPHAEILNIDTTEAQKHPGVVAVLTAKDVPGRSGFGSLKPNQPVLCRDRVRYLGGPVAFVVANTPEAAAATLKLIKVDYKPLPGIYSPEVGLKQDAILLYLEGNICKHLVHEVGNIDEVKPEAYVVVTGHFETPFVEHGYLEPEAGIGLIDENGVLTVYAPTQFPFEVRKQLPEVFNMPEDKVRVIVTPLGGAFGSKCDATVEFLVALGAYCTKRPVKLTLSRQESMRMSTKRHPYSMDYEVGATKDGKLLYVDAKLLVRCRSL